MRLKFALTIGDPKSAQIVAYQARSTGNSHLTKIDVLTALGMTQARYRGGLSLLYAKYTKDLASGKMALNELNQYALNVSRKHVGRIEGGRSGYALKTLSSFVLADYCRTLDTPGEKCRCGGVGEVVNRKQTERTGVLTHNNCSKCKGTGLKPMTRAKVHRAISALVPGVSQSTWSRRWNAFYDELLAWCYANEARAESEYQRITGMSEISAHRETGIDP